ncbi:hypothetical protein [Roseibacillus persicicus]|uniref:Uncharacterized protein n=1 Tax=Roseibacillus persicicus TaxID=454148 RepID=A0A918WQF4_9BACT|nr:hypothetical protein [Roseibacillus persicicus]GHC64418.1 hypothetical protein GCM10007100_35190 [Roseibacillus persicicus]
MIRSKFRKLVPLFLILSSFVRADEASVKIDVKEKVEVPLYYSAIVEQQTTVNGEFLTHNSEISIKVIQGEPKTFSFALLGGGEVSQVEYALEGESPLQSWATRQGPDGAFLDITVKAPQDNYRFRIAAEQEFEELPNSCWMWNLGPGNSVGFKSELTVSVEAGSVAEFDKLIGLTPERKQEEKTGWQNLLGAGPVSRKLVTTTGGEIHLIVRRDGIPVDRFELLGASLTGEVNEESESATFFLKGSLVAHADEVSLPLLRGGAAVSELPSVAGLRFFVKDGQYFVEAEKAGSYELSLPFVAKLVRESDQSHLSFTIPSTTVLPVELTGLDQVKFSEELSVKPVLTEGRWQGYVPSSGQVSLGWSEAGEEEDGALFFSSEGLVDVQVGAGLLRQDSYLGLRILQGELEEVLLLIDGPGEVLAVEGEDVLSWERNDAGLRVRFREAIEKQVRLKVRSQVALAAFPVESQTLRLNPEGTVRHAGYLRVRNEGAVRLEVAEAEGLMQLAPDEFPGQAIEARQQFVYRFPTNEYALSLQASQISPEVSIAETLVYELGDSDRAIAADVELDIREAALREWEIEVPGDYSVVSVSGAKVGDYVVGSDVQEGRRVLRVIFSEEVTGRQLVTLQLEKNEPVSEGEWVLPQLVHPNAKAVRGDVGVVGAPGFRVTIGSVDKLAEKPLSFFPKRPEGLQLAFRERERDWSATLNVERLPRSVEADVFHLYSLKDGTAFGSVVVNYFITGSPVDEWKLKVPENAGNVAVDGQNVRTWRREGNEVIVTLQQPVIGLYTLLLTCEEVVGAQGGEVRPGRVEPLGVRGERGFVQVVSPVQVKSEVAQASDGLLKLDALELPAEFRLSSSAPSLAVYQYTERPFELAMNIEWYEPGETVEQVVEFAEAKSRISRDGEVVTDAVYSVKTRGGRVLRLGLPEAVRLWEVRVNGEAVNARKDGDATLVPLPAGADANETVEVKVRYGRAAVSPTHPKLVLPSVAAPVLKTEWNIQGDERRQLVLRGEEATALEAGVSGFDWVGGEGLLPTIAVMALVAGAVALGRVTKIAGGIILGLSLALLVLLLIASWYTPVEASSHLDIGVPVLAPGEVVEAKVSNFDKARSQWDWTSISIIFAGLIWLGYGVIGRKERWHAFGGILLAGAGCLWMEGGAFWFFLLFALVVLGVGWKVLAQKPRAKRTKTDPDEGGDSNNGPSVAATTLLLLAGGLFLGQPVKAEEIPAAETLVQKWTVDEHRISAEAELTLVGEEGDTFRFLRSGVTLKEFSGEGLRLSSDEDGYLLTVIALFEEGPPADVIEGETERQPELVKSDSKVRRAQFSYEMVQDPAAVRVPTAVSAVGSLEVTLNKSGWGISCESAAQVVEGEDEGTSSARLILLPRSEAVVVMKLRERDPLKEKTAFFVEVANAYIPGPGLLEGRHQVSIQPAQGVVRQLKMMVPEGLAVSNVGEGPVADWRFSAESRELVVDLREPQSAAFSLVVITQRSLGSLPLDLAVKPLRVLGGERELGTLGIAFRGEAQAERIEVDGLLEVNLADFPSQLLREGVEILHRAYRYGSEAAEARLQMVPVAPEVRVETDELLSLGAERLLLKVNVKVEITRAGIFRFSFPVPDGFEVESLSGEALSHWNESGEGEERTVTVHLKGQTLGSHAFALVLAKAGLLSDDEEQEEVAKEEDAGWSVPRFTILEAARQTGQLVVRAEQGIRLRTLSRKNVSEIDPRSAGASDKNGAALAFRLLQKEWELSLGIEKLDPWVTGQVLQEVTLREGQTRNLVIASLKVENAAVRRVLVRFPNLTEEMTKTLRASGSAVSGISPVEGEEGVWEIGFKRRVIGSQQVRIEWERTGERAEGAEMVQTLVFPELRQVSSYVALRAGAQLEVTLGDLPEGWYRLDWTAVPSELRDAGAGGIPALALRSGGAPLQVSVARHAVAEALKLRVSKGELTTVVSPMGDLLTAVKLQLDVIQRSTLRIAFETEGELFNVFVNGESVSVVRDGAGYLFYVVPGSGGGSAEVEFAYTVNGTAGKALALRSPEISVPLENIEWRVIVPEGYQLDDIAGDLELKEEEGQKFFRKDSYLSSIQTRTLMEKKKAQQAFDKADSLLQAGQQAEALQLYQNVANNYNLDDATNEDARVKLNRVQTDQVMAGLNSRRQRLYLDNAFEGTFLRNSQLEIAAASNGILQGEVNFRPEELGQLLLGNSREENDFLRRIADRLVKHQKATEPAPQAISVPVPEEGRVFVFRRSVRVDEGKPLELGMKLGKSGSADTFRVVVVLLLLAVGAASFAFGPRRAK